MPDPSGDTIIERELTFLASKIPKEMVDIQPKHVADAYVPENTSFAVLRVRQKGDRYEITKKAPVITGDYSSNREQTIPLNAAEFAALYKASSNRVEKDRYSVVINNYPAEVDIFTGPLKGLILIDFEFSNDADQQAFVMSDCCLADVTQEHFTLGGQLAGKTYADIEANLQKFNYHPLVKE